MLISESLKTINSYPIPDLTIEKVGIDRGLTITDEYTAAVAVTQSYELATADVYMWLYAAPNVKEQEISFSSDDRDKFFNLANLIYGKYGDAKYSGKGKFGFKGDKWNG